MWEWGRNGTVGEVFERLSAFESIDLGNPQLQEIFHSLIFFLYQPGKKEKPKNEWDIQRLGELFERTGKKTRKYLQQVEICNPATGN